MSHNTRDASLTYRVVKIPDTPLAYNVTVFPDTDPNNIVTITYREDTIPQWMLEKMHTLDLSGKESHSLPFFGEKKGSAYWFYSDEVYNTSVQLKVSTSFFRYHIMWHECNAKK